MLQIKLSMLIFLFVLCIPAFSFAEEKAIVVNASEENNAAVVYKEAISNLDIPDKFDAKIGSSISSVPLRIF